MTLAIASVAVIMFACKKEGEPDPTTDNTSVTSSVVQRLLDFQQQVKYYTANPYIKDGEAMETDEAVNDIVDLFNAVYSEPDAYYEQIARHEFSLTIPVTSEGKVLASDVASLYNQAVNMAADAYHNDGFVENKGYALLTATVEPQRDGTVTMNFSGKTGEKGICPPIPPLTVEGPFEEGDNFHYTEGIGNDDGADVALVRALYSLVIDTVTPDGCRYIYYGGIPAEFNHSMGYDDIFYRTDTENTLIYWNEMNFYYQGEIRNIYRVVPENDLHISLTGLNAYFVKDVDIKGIYRQESIYHHTCVEYYHRVMIHDAEIQRDVL